MSADYPGAGIDEVVNAFTYDAQGQPSNYTYHHDALQSVVGLSGHAGTVEETLRYGPFGEVLSSTGSSPSALRYTGREHDVETGLYYYRARYYDPAIGRFLSEDPLGFGAGDPNLYAYVGNNPRNANDPRGLESLYAGLQLSGGYVWGGEVEVVFGVDTAGNFGFSRSIQTGPHFGLDFELGAVGGYDSRPTIQDSLQGDVLERGFGFDAGIVEVDFTATSSNINNPLEVTGAEVSISRNLLIPVDPGIPAEIHGYAGKSSLVSLGRSESLGDVVDFIVNLGGMLVGDAPYQEGRAPRRTGADDGFVVYPSDPNRDSAVRAYVK